MKTIFLLLLLALPAQAGTFTQLLYGQPQTKGLLAIWNLDETSGTTSVDKTGNGKTLTLVNTPAWGAGQWNNSLAFTGASSQKATVTVDISSLTTFSMSFWFKRTSSSAIVTFGVSQDATHEVAFTAFNDNNYYFFVGTGATGFATFSENNTAWHHMVIIFDGSQSGNSGKLKVYRDNSLLSLSFTGTIPSSFPSSTSSWELGHNTAAGYYATGSLDAIRVYNLALDAGDVSRLYRQSQ